MELLGLRRARSRDVATGVVLGASLGLTSLVFYLDATRTAVGAGATTGVLFGSVFTIDPSIMPTMALLSVAAIAVVVLLFRPLLLAAVDADMASARGVPVRAAGLAYLCALAVAVSMASITTGAILSTALLLGPAATALRITRRPATALSLRRRSG